MELGRMVLNPDVVVRSRGVMEKCSMCAQRLQAGKLVAKKSGMPLVDGSIKTACQQACATGSIKFGNANDPESEIYKIRHSEDKERMFYVLEQLHVLPNVNYLSKIRNTEKIVAGSHSVVDRVFIQNGFTSSELQKLNYFLCVSNERHLIAARYYLHFHPILTLPLHTQSSI